MAYNPCSGAALKESPQPLKTNLENVANFEASDANLGNEKELSENSAVNKELDTSEHYWGGYRPYWGGGWGGYGLSLIHI